MLNSINAEWMEIPLDRAIAAASRNVAVSLDIFETRMQRSAFRLKTMSVFDSAANHTPVTATCQRSWSRPIRGMGFLTPL